MYNTYNAIAKYAYFYYYRVQNETLNNTKIIFCNNCIRGMYYNNMCYSQGGQFIDNENLYVILYNIKPYRFPVDHSYSSIRTRVVFTFD